ncbi:MAG: transcriptional repressor [Anaerolineae bacterium]|jgi:Fe2+ or Zn2+ uptake regulation protein|nr:transcriptional repressor [Anaerolineae bacterium]
MLAHTIDANKWLTALRENGCRITDVQEMLVHILAHTEIPLSAEQVWETARQIRPETGRATVYRMVEKLESLNLLRRIHGYQGCCSFLPTLPEPMMLFICLVCGRADYLDGQPLHDLIHQSERSSGHHITDSRLQLFGTCVACQQHS